MPVRIRPSKREVVRSFDFMANDKVLDADGGVEPDESVGNYKRLESKDTDQVLRQVLGEMESARVHETQRELRRKLLERIAELTTPKKGQAGVVAFLCSEQHGGSIDQGDVPAIGDALLSLGDLHTLNLLINGPGGDGTVAEKLIELCRAHCKRFTVIVPNRAKSAATIIALGADQIVMGYCSELGPIDAQVMVTTGGIPRYISAQSFIAAKSQLERDFQDRVKSKEDPRDVLQQLATLDNAFIAHCQWLMDFGRDVVRKNLEQHMLKNVSDTVKRRDTIDTVLKELSSVDLFKVHGRMFDGITAKNKLRLNVRLLGKQDLLWKAIWEYYIRADVTMDRQGATTFIETTGTSLIKSLRVK